MTPCRYEIVVEGELGPRLGGKFAPLEITVGEHQTTIAGDIRDQSELKSVLDLVSALGLSLVSVERRPAG